MVFKSYINSHRVPVYVYLFFLFMASLLLPLTVNSDTPSPSSNEASPTSLDENKGTGDTPADLKRAGKRSWMRAGVSNYKNSVALMEQNKSQLGVVTLKSGLQYKILKQGEGGIPTKTDTVEVYFQGTLIDGTIFASAPNNLNPAVFKMAEVIPGWRQALSLMPVGSRWQLFVPPSLGYGTKGLSPSIGPNATLIYDLELVKIRPAASPKTVQKTPHQTQTNPSSSTPQ